MIKLNFYSISKEWPRRLSKIKLILNKVLKEQVNLKFNKKTDYYLNIILVNDAEIKKLNRNYKKINKATDVLTFVSSINNKIKTIKYCDIFFSAETIMLDSKRNKTDFYDHFTHLVIHSFLHINGYLHKKIKNFKEMKRLEIQILYKLGLKNPYLLS